MKLTLDHIGFVVPRIDEVMGIFEALGFEGAIGPEPDETQKVTASFIEIAGGNNVYLEILEPTAPDSPVVKFLKSTGGGLHHLCFTVDDIDEGSRRLEAKGFRTVCAPVDCPAYDKSFHGPCTTPTRIAFFLTPGRLLVELIEKGS